MAVDGSLAIRTLFHELVTLGASGEPRFQIGGVSSSSLQEPVLGPNGTVSFAASDGKVYALDASGQTRWNFLSRFGALVAESTGGLLITGTNHLVALDAQGVERWRLDLVEGAPTAPLLTDDGLVCLSVGNRMVGLKTNFRPAPSGWAMFRADPQRSGRTARVLSITAFRRTVAGAWELSFGGEAGVVYLIEQSEDLRAWSLSREVNANSGLTHTLLPAESERRTQYYRVRRR